MSKLFPLLRRSIIIIELKDPFIEWVFNIREAHYGCSQISLQNIRKRAGGRKNAYLLPQEQFGNPDAFVR